MRRLIGLVDRLGGLLAYRLFGTLIAFMAIGSAFVSWNLLTANGDSPGNRSMGVVLAVVTVLLALSTAWCFSPRRRLSDLE
jgi:hypothetical protein